MSTPSAHQSTALPCPLLRMISGARYSGVPHSVHVLPIPNNSEHAAGQSDMADCGRQSQR